MIVENALPEVKYALKGQAEGRGRWMKAVEDRFDFASLAAMLG